MTVKYFYKYHMILGLDYGSDNPSNEKEGSKWKEISMNEFGMT